MNLKTELSTYTFKEKVKLWIFATMFTFIVATLLVGTIIDYAKADDTSESRIATQIKDNSFIWNRVEARKLEIINYVEEYNTIIELQEELHNSNENLRKQLSFIKEK